jgi:hypothetical protein
VATVGGLPAPTGTVFITTEGTNSPIGYTSPVVQLVNGSASVTVAANSILLGPQTLTANYSGDIYYNGNTGTATVQVNSTGTIKPTLMVTAPTAPVAYPFPITVTASGPSGDPPATGTVLFVSPYYQTSQTLIGGSTTFDVQQGMGAGPNTVTFTYLGDSNYTGATDTAFVNLISYPLITFTPPYQTIAVNQPLSVTVAVGGDANIATGTVTLSSGTYTSSPTQLNAGSASFTIPAFSLAVGIDGLTATYSGDPDYYAGSDIVSVGVTGIPLPALTIFGTPVTVSPGATTGNISTITITPSSGFTGTVSLSCAITPAAPSDPATCSIPASVTVSGAAAQTATLTVNTTAATTSLNQIRKLLWPSAGGAALALALFFGIPTRRRSWRAMLGMLLSIAFLTGGVLSCGGGGGGGSGSGGGGTSIPGTTPGTYTVTVTGISGAIAATGTLTLTVQ